MHDILLDIYERLLTRFGPQQWWPADGAFEIIIGAILTQSTSWANVTRALDNLKRAGVLDPLALAPLPDDRLAALIRPSGFWRGKTRKIRAFMNLLSGEYGGDLDRLLAVETVALRRTLLATHGIGPETADDIVLYAAGRPVFVIDAYTRRIFARLGHCPPIGRYEDLQDLFMRSLPPDAALFGEYHALLVRLGKTTCTKSSPRCGDCPLREICATGSGAGRQAGAPVSRTSRTETTTGRRASNS